MFFSHLGGAWGSGDTRRRHQEMIAYCAMPRHPQSDLCEAGGKLSFGQASLRSV